MARAPKLKVYSTSIGFDDALVAVPSQKAALAAWGTTTDLFAAGRATAVDDPELAAEALARPGQVVRRPHGDPKKLLAEMEAEERAERTRSAPRPKPSRPEPLPPDRSELDGAERALAEAERNLGHRMDEFASERTDLDRRERTAREDGEATVRDLARAKERAAAAFRRAVDASKAGRG